MASAGPAPTAERLARIPTIHNPTLCATLFIQISYLAASVCFILGLRSLTKPDKARRGVQLAAIGMLLAVAGTLANHQIVD